MNQLSQEKMKFSCAWCAGSGQKTVSAHYVISCLVCGGKGYISKAAQSTQKCSQCLGTGKSSGLNACLTCSGSGWRRTFEFKSSVIPDKAG